MNNKFKYIGRSKLRQKLHQRCDLKNIKIFENKKVSQQLCLKMSINHL